MSRRTGLQVKPGPIDATKKDEHKNFMLCEACEPSAAEIHLFGDGSFQQLIEFGAWAFAIPSLGVEEAGVEAASCVEYFEILAALSAVRTALEVDHTNRPLRVHTDSEFALLFLRSALKRNPLPPTRSFERVAALYEVATDLLGQRSTTVEKVKAARFEHQECHRRALRCLREALGASQTLVWQLARRREEERLQIVAKERNGLQQRLDKLEEEILLIGVRLQALEQNRPHPPVISTRQAIAPTP